MKKLLSRMALVGALLASVAMVGQTTTAYGAGVSGAAVIGQGTISPGLDDTLPGTIQSVTFGGSAIGGGIATGVGTQVGIAVGDFTCTFNGGSSIPETRAAGSGTASGTCNGGTVGTGTIACTATYARAGALVLVVLTGCSASASGPLGTGSASGALGAGLFVFVPDQLTPPVTSYRLVGASAGAGA
ncbi:MAG: hypothetical protein QOK43_1542 [Acidimicrobiaceae bacterium]|nr:hypothetical protein [Acidimicrobiaceae bacterium]